MNPHKSSLFPFQLFKHKLLATGGGIAIITTLGLVILWQSSNYLLKNITNLFHYQVTSPQVDTSHLIVEQIQNISELTTTVFVMDAIVPTSSSRKIGDIVLGETKLLYLARGKVKAGLDLSQITAENVKIADNEITIQLPAPQILDSKIDVNHSQVYDYDRGFFNLGPDNATELQTQAQRQTLAKVVDTACNQGILDQANERATLIITQLLQTGGYENIIVNTTKPETCVANQ